jgi:hypothetical protein
LHLVQERALSGEEDADAMRRRALEIGRIDQDGGGDMATMVQECRRHAVAFLDEIGDHFDSEPHVHLD